MPVKEYDTHELAWAAGFFDGEGYCGVGARGRNPMMHVTQAGDQVALTRFLNAVGGLGYLNKGYNPPAPRKTQYRWVATQFEHVQAVAGLLWNWLSPSGKAKIVKAMTLAKQNGGLKPLLSDPDLHPNGAAAKRKGRVAQRCEHEEDRWKCPSCLRDYHREYEKAWYHRNIEKMRAKNAAKARNARARKREVV